VRAAGFMDCFGLGSRFLRFQFRRMVDHLCTGQTLPYIALSGLNQPCPAFSLISRKK
jgi:hypothetical protein